ncbi:GNAT family N-acetyltransferase [Alkalihalobacillus sp. AL-G]|uniref:GNAT family N-acetyltransferase n=1 Tax=Alkalihalobacillus sp. AL-G TaxID=2926399 RepID=UPI002729EC30|nr:GNAT family N-acetyltransferase [Alkalihalobacillus sp. AL-G]WLD91581.1 GNAT family N-acetyltransferase [Alkalihalobacillus sp. AL-G]
MNYKRYYSAIEFIEQAEDFLLLDEAKHNLPLGILSQCAAKERESQSTDPKPYFALIRDDKGIALTLIMTPPFNLGIFGDEKHGDLDHAFTIAVNNLLKERVTIPGVIGANQLVEPFVDQWGKTTGAKPVIAMEQAIYELTEVQSVPVIPGKMRAATEQDLDLVINWIHEFTNVTEAPLSKEDSIKRAKEFIGQRSIHMWEDGEPVSMARQARSTKNGIVINLVYTPPEFQRKGYATSCVAALSQKLLDSGYKFCSLYTDLSNPTSNRIYGKIGYRTIGESIVYRFETD